MSYYLAPRTPARERRFLGQDLPIDLALDAGADTPTASEVRSFASWYAQYQAAWTDFLHMDATIQDHLARWSRVAQDAARAGDTASEDQATQRLAWLETAKATHEEVQALVDKFSSTWETFRSYVSSAGRWVGLGALGIAPLVLPVAIVAAIAALAFVVTKIVELRQGLSYDGQLLTAVEAGRLTGATAAALSAAAHGGGGGPSLGTWLVLGAAGAVALSWAGVLGGRGRT